MRLSHRILGLGRGNQPNLDLMSGLVTRELSGKTRELLGFSVITTGRWPVKLAQVEMSAEPATNLKTPTNGRGVGQSGPGSFGSFSYLAVNSAANASALSSRPVASLVSSFQLKRAPGANTLRFMKSPTARLLT
jgi:hypothetical protein